MRKTRKILCVLILWTAFLLIGTIKSNAGYLSLNNLDFEVQINSDGSMDVTEKWDIDIEETNTLYKTFKTDSSRYTKIKDVFVKETTSGRERNFTKTNNWAYHVAKNSYYGTENEDGYFEIGWGVGLDNSSATRKYEISYTVEDAIAKYNDCAELYWQFIGNDFEISCDKITGTIYLPSDVSDIEEIRVWGHTEGLNGTIYATDTDKIEFNINNFRSGRYVEVRTLFPAELIYYSGRTRNKEVLQTVINEETKWAEEANARRERSEFINRMVISILLVVCVVVNIILIIIFLKKTSKYLKKNKELKKYTPTTKLEYYRDLPDENSTPGEAVKTLDINIGPFTPVNFGKVFSATMLDLSLKGYLEIKQEKNNKGKDAINIYILKQVTDGLKPSDARIMTFVIDAAKGEKVLTLKELEKYIKKYPTKIESLLKETYDAVNNQLINEQIIDAEIQKEYQKYNDKQLGYILAIIFLLCFTLIAFILPVIIFIIDAVICGKIAKKLNVLTQKGVDMKEQWKGLKKYMEDFSMLDRREVPELVIWEKYLVYATAFGIADKVIKQLKIVYPNLDEMTSGVNTFVYMNLMTTTNFGTTFSNSISSSMSSAYSSGSGGGGGFSGGGGGRTVAGGGGGRKIKNVSKWDVSFWTKMSKRDRGIVNMCPNWTKMSKKKRPIWTKKGK